MTPTPRRRSSRRSAVLLPSWPPASAVPLGFAERRSLCWHRFAYRCKPAGPCGAPDIAAGSRSAPIGAGPPPHPPAGQTAPPRRPEYRPAPGPVFSPCSHLTELYAEIPPGLPVPPYEPPPPRIGYSG